MILKIWGYHLKSWPIYQIPLDLLYPTITFGCAYMVCLISIFQTFFWNRKYWILFKTLHCISVHIHNFKPLNSMIPYFILEDSLSLKIPSIIFALHILLNLTGKCNHICVSYGRKRTNSTPAKQVFILDMLLIFSWTKVMKQLIKLLLKYFTFFTISSLRFREMKLFRF